MTASGYQLGHDCAVTLFETTDIGGTSVGTAWVDMRGFDRVFAYVEVGTFDAADDLDELRLEQATSVAGANAKDITTDGAGITNNYNSTNPLDADGNWAILECHAEDLDMAGGFYWVRVVAAEGGNTGPDFVTGFLIRYGAQHKYKERNGAAVGGATLYINPQSPGVT